MSTVEFARLKHDIDSKKVQVDKAFARLDDFVRGHEGKANSAQSAESECNELREKLVILERLMEAMSKLNASYKVYTQMLEKSLGI